jgi:hypothetical protein
MTRALISCSDEIELSGGYCSPRDGSWSSPSGSDPANEGSSDCEVRWACCRSGADGLRDVSCSDSDRGDWGDAVFLVEDGRGGGSMKGSDRLHIETKS